MSVILVPRLVNLPSQEIIWPKIGQTPAFAVGSAFESNGSVRGIGTNKQVFTDTAGTATQNMSFYRESLCGRFTAGASTFSERRTGAFRIHLPLTVLTLSPGFRYAEWNRVVRVSHALARNAFNADTGSGVAFCSVTGGGVTGYPASAATNCGWGIQGDGAGGWQWFCKTTVAGGFVDQTPLAWPSALTEWVMVDWELRCATPTAPASVRLFLDGVLFITRSWGPGTLLPDYTAVLNSGQWAYGVRANGPNGLEIYFGSAAFRYGRFTVDDVELLSGFQSAY